MKRKATVYLNILIFLAVFSGLLTGCTGVKSAKPYVPEDKTYTSEVVPLEREGIKLHLEYMKMKGSETEKNILLNHGVTYSSHEFDINYRDYSLVRKLAREGYCVWRLDIAGFGMSEEIDDGFRPDSDYAAEDIAAAVDKIVSETGQQKISSVPMMGPLIIPTLILCGSEDPYLNYDLVNTALNDLPEGSALEVIEGGSHVVLVEKPFYHDFQDRLIRFLEKP